jgi:tetratricopeptide (TPR) repeat protein
VRGVSTGRYLLTQFRVLWTYLRLMIAPVGLNLDRDFAASTNLLHPWTTLVAAVALAGLLGGLAWLAWRAQPAALWGLGFFLLIAPSSSIVAQADMMFEHRTYLPMVCAAMGLALLLARVPRVRLIAVFAILVPLMLAGTISRNEDWHDEKTFWSDIATKSPNKGRAWLGLARAFAGDPVKESEYLQRGLVLDPENPDLHTNYGIALFARKRFGEALEHFNRAMAIAGETADGWNNIGGAYFQLNHPADSLRSFEKALQFDPCNFNARRNVMMLHSQANDPHSVWAAGELPRSCAMLPDEARAIDALRHQAGKP